MLELELGGARCDVEAAPLDHAAVRVDAQIPARTSARAEHLPRQTAASAPVVEHELVHVRWQLRQCLVHEGRIELVDVRWADQMPQFERREGKIDQTGMFQGS